MNSNFHIGINVFVTRNDMILLGKRRGTYGEGDWGLPGGHLEQGESMLDAATRELFEETGIECQEFEFANILNDPQEDDKHYIQIGFKAKNFKGEPILKEPERCYEWKWFPAASLPKNIFNPHKKTIESYISGEPYFIDSK